MEMHADNSPNVLIFTRQVASMLHADAKGIMPASDTFFSRVRAIDAYFEILLLATKTI